jgi:hypothetical protein
MIEVEKKLNPSFGTVGRIKNDAVFVASKTMNDVLYDYPDLSLIKNNIWLRKRNGKFELKVTKDKDRKNRFLDIYDEIEEESRICETLNIKSITDGKFIEVANLITKREKYKLGEFNIAFVNSVLVIYFSCINYLKHKQKSPEKQIKQNGSDRISGVRYRAERSSFNHGNKRNKSENSAALSRC